MEDTNRADVHALISERPAEIVNVIAGRGIKSQIVIGQKAGIYFDGYIYESAEQCISSGGSFVFVRFTSARVERVMFFRLGADKGEDVSDTPGNLEIEPLAFKARRLIADFIAMDDEVDASYHKP